MSASSPQRLSVWIDSAWHWKFSFSVCIPNPLGGQFLVWVHSKPWKNTWYIEGSKKFFLITKPKTLAKCCLTLSRRLEDKKIE